MTGKLYSDLYERAKFNGMNSVAVAFHAARFYPWFMDLSHASIRAAMMGDPTLVFLATGYVHSSQWPSMYVWPGAGGSP